MRLEYFKIAPNAIKAMSKVSEYLDNSAIELELRHLVELRVSQINGCAYCVDLHSQQLRKTEKISQKQLDCVVVWDESGLFDERQKVALAWAEAVTRIEASKVPDELYSKVSKTFTEKEIVDLTLVISTMNAWNRLAVSFRREPGQKSS